MTAPREDLGPPTVGDCLRALAIVVLVLGAGVGLGVLAIAFALLAAS